MFARLAPHCGLQPVYGTRIGTSDMRGGFSWSSLGSSLSSGLSKIGNFVTSTAKQIGNSEAFKQAKQGLLQSGVLENAGQLAGQTINSLVDIGRLKLEHDLQKLRDKVVSQNENVTQEQLAQLLAAMNQTPKNEEIAVPMPQPIPVNPPAPAPIPTPIPAPLPMPIPEVIDRPTPLPYFPPEDKEIQAPPQKRRKRRRASGWGAALDNLVGSGVSFSSRRMCH